MTINVSSVGSLLGSFSLYILSRSKCGKVEEILFFKYFLTLCQMFNLTEDVKKTAKNDPRTNVL